VTNIDVVSDKLRGFDQFLVTFSGQHDWGKVWKKA